MSSSSPVLTPVQEKVLGFFAREKDLVAEFILSGGTALAAFHLHHRRSDDLDFFSLRPVDPLRVRRFVESVRSELSAGDIEPIKIYDRHLFTLDVHGSSLKLEFTQYPYPALENPLEKNGVYVESIRDIAADKLAAMLDRFEPKDYYDLYFLLSEHTTLEKVRADARRKFSIKADPISLGAALVRGADLPVLPHLLKPLAKDVVQKFFDDLARGLHDEVMQ